MFKKTDFKIIFENLRFVYFMAYMMLIALASTIPGRRLLEGRSVGIYSAIAIVGVILLAIDFFTRRVIFKPKYCTILFIYIIACIISSIYNIKYGFMSNAKAVIWSCIQFFLIIGVDTELPQNIIKKHFRILTETFSAFWFVCVLISIYQFIIQYSDIWYFQSQFRPVREGFCDGRLYGIFSDPNFASLCSIFTIFFCFINFKGNSLNKVYHVFNVIMQLFYIILSGSRTSMICFSVALCIFIALLVWNKLENIGLNRIKKTLSSTLAVALCIFMLIAGSSLIRTVSISCAKLYLQSIGQSVDGEIEISNEDIDDSEISLDRPDVSGNADVSNGRLTIWKEYLKVFTKSPVFGTSPRNAMDFAKDHFDSLYIIDVNYSIHNTYLAILVCTGIFGTIILGIWAVATFLEISGYIIRRRKSKDEHYNTVVILTMILVTCAIAAFPSLFIFFDNQIPDIPFWITLGYAKAFIRLSEPERYTKETLIGKVANKIIPSFKK